MKKAFLNVFSFSLTKLPVIWKAAAAYGAECLRIVFYHMVSEKKHAYYFDTAIDPQTFQRQVKFLKKKYKIISLLDAVRMAERGEKLKNCLCLTFDDGFRECYTYIAPILMEEDLPATFFLLERMIDNGDLMWRNKLLYFQNKIPAGQRQRILRTVRKRYGIEIPESFDSIFGIGHVLRMVDKDLIADRIWQVADIAPLDEWLESEKPYLALKEIEELRDAGFTFGSHSKSHPFCDQLAYHVLVDETIHSAKRLGYKIGQKIEMFSYPFGIRVNDDTERRLIKNSEIKCWLGITNILNNRAIISAWERDNLEYSHSEDFARFILRPILNKVRKYTF